MARYAVHVCDNTIGRFVVHYGKQSYHFEDNSVFGPYAYNGYDDSIDFVPDGHKWFWNFYEAWTRAGRPDSGRTLSMPYTLAKIIDWPIRKEAPMAPANDVAVEPAEKAPSRSKVRMTVEARDAWKRIAAVEKRLGEGVSFELAEAIKEELTHVSRRGRDG